jgi:hypothetical protein
MGTGSDTGESDGDDRETTGPLPDADREALLAAYRELNARHLELSRRWNRRITRGTLAVVAIVGYAVAERPVVVAVAPFAVLFLLIAHTIAENDQTRLLGRIARIERRIDVDGFAYERTRGLYSPHFRSPKSQLPLWVMNGFVGTLFLSTMALGWFAVYDSQQCVVCPTTGGLTLLYALALATVVALFYSNTRIYLDELSEVRDEDGD